MAKKWGGRIVRPLINHVVVRDGGVCWLCDLLGADSADHEPPRADLVKLGVPNPDDPAYLRASHLICNQRRGRRTVTKELKAELRRRRLVDLDRAANTAPPSPRFSARSFESIPLRGKHLLPHLFTEPTEKTPK